MHSDHSLSSDAWFAPGALEWRDDVTGEVFESRTARFFRLCPLVQEAV